MQINKSYKVALLALCSLAILYYGCLFLKGRNVFSKYNVYQVSYPVNKNLSVSAPVKLKGHVVGTVTKIEIQPKQNYHTLITIEVDKQLTVTDKSKIMLNNAGMMEGNVLELELHAGKPLAKHSLIIGEFHPDFNEFDLRTVTAQVSTVTNNLIKTTESVNAILGNIEKTSQALNTAINTIQHNIIAFTKNIVTISHPLADPITGIPAMVTSIQNILSKMNAVPVQDISLNITRILNNVETLLQHVSNVHGTLGLLINDAALYNNLNHTAVNLNALVLDIRKRPSNYINFSIFGPSRNKQEPLTPP